MQIYRFSCLLESHKNLIFAELIVWIKYVCNEMVDKFNNIKWANRIKLFECWEKLMVVSWMIMS